MNWEEVEKTEELEEAEKPRSLFKEIMDVVIYFGGIFLLTFLIVTFVGQRTEVSGSSMYDTLENGDQLIVDKLSYRLGNPERFDIVVFLEDPTDKTYYIKRIIGLPGETVQIIGSGIYINGELLEENYGYEPIKKAGRAAQEITLGEDEYFVLGDNRNNSQDSRKEVVGNVKRSQFMGKAFIRIWPLTGFGFLE